MRINNENTHDWGFGAGSCGGFFGDFCEGFCFASDTLSGLYWAP